MFTFLPPLERTLLPPLVAATLPKPTPPIIILIPVGGPEGGLSLLLTLGKWNRETSKSSRVAEAPWESPVITIQPLAGIVGTGCYSKSTKSPRAVEVSVALLTTPVMVGH